MCIQETNIKRFCLEFDFLYISRDSYGIYSIYVKFLLSFFRGCCTISTKNEILSFSSFSFDLLLSTEQCPLYNMALVSHAFTVRSLV